MKRALLYLFLHVIFTASLFGDTYKDLKFNLNIPKDYLLIEKGLLDNSNILNTNFDEFKNTNIEMKELSKLIENYLNSQNKNKKVGVWIQGEDRLIIVKSITTLNKNFNVNKIDTFYSSLKNIFINKFKIEVSPYTILNSKNNHIILNVSYEELSYKLGFKEFKDYTTLHYFINNGPHTTVFIISTPNELMEKVKNEWDNILKSFVSIP